MQKKNLNLLIRSALFLALGIILPFFTAQIKELGDTFLPMHIPIMLCGLTCGPWYGLLVGIILPFIRSLMFSMPPMYPNAIWMALELATYGFVIGILFRRSKKYSLRYLYFCLISSIISGRIVWGISKAALLGISGNPFTFTAFLTGGFLDSIPGIILQLILIPAIMSAIVKLKEKNIPKELDK